jgi:hypothetical protein
MVWVERPEWKWRFENKNLHFHKSGNEGKSGIHAKTVRAAGLILLFAEKCCGGS